MIATRLRVVLFSGSCVSVMFVVQAFDGGRKLAGFKGFVEVFIETGSERRVSIGSGGIGGQRNCRRIPDLWPLFFAKGCDECIPIVIRHADVCDYDINQLWSLHGLERLGNVTGQNGACSVRLQNDTQ